MLRKAWGAYQTGHWRSAQNLFFASMLTQPRAIDAWRGLLISTCRLEQSELAIILIRVIRRLFVLQPNDAERLVKMTTALEANRNLDGNKELNDHDIVRHVQLCLKHEKGLPALFMVDALIEKYPCVPFYRVLQAHALDIMGQVSAAIVSFDEALVLAKGCEDGRALFLEISLQRLEFLLDIGEYGYLKIGLSEAQTWRDELDHAQQERLHSVIAGVN